MAAILDFCYQCILVIFINTRQMAPALLSLVNWWL